MYELREPNQLQRFYDYVAANPNVWGSLAAARFEIVSGRGVVVEVIPGLRSTSTPRILARFDRSPRSVSPSVLAFPFLLEKGWLKSLTVPQDLIEPFRAFSTETQKAYSTRQKDATAPSTSPRKDNWRAFERVVNQQGIKYLYHFTDSRNLEPIRENSGLYSWWQCRKAGIEIPAPGSNERSRKLDEENSLEDYVRLSFNPFLPMKHAARVERRVEDLRTLMVDASVIYLEPTLFSDVNANDKGARVGGDLASFKRIEFHIATGKRRNIAAEKKSFQAEVLVKSHVPLDLIENV